MKLASLPMPDRQSRPQLALTQEQQALARLLENDEDFMSCLGHGIRKQFPTGTGLLPTQGLCDCRRQQQKRAC